MQAVGQGFEPPMLHHRGLDQASDLTVTDRASARRSLFVDAYTQLASTARQVDLALVAELKHNMRDVCVSLAISVFDPTWLI